MATLADVLRGYTPPTESALADPIAQHLRNIPQKFAQNQQAQMDLLGKAYPGNTYESMMTQGDPKALAELAMQAPVTGTVGNVAKALQDKGLILDVYESAKTPKITLSRIEVPKEMRGQGMGTEALNELTQYADQSGKTIALSPSTDFGATSVNRLKDFYKRFGFVENKGRNKDFAISESMYRPASAPSRKEIIEQELSKIEDYKGSHTAPNAKVYGGTLDALENIMPADVYGSKGIRLYGIGDPTIDREWFAAAYKAKGNPEAMVDVYRAVPKGVKDINHGDWVTTSKKYAENHGENALNGEYEILSKKVKASTLSSEGYPYEFGYHE